MTVVFDAEPLLAFAFDEPGADTVEGWLDRVYDGELDGVVPTLTLAEFRYVATREASAEKADDHLDDLRNIGVTEYGIDGLWSAASRLKATYNPSLADAYLVAVAASLDDDVERNVTLLVGADDDYDVFEEDERYAHLIDRIRSESS